MTSHFLPRLAKSVVLGAALSVSLAAAAVAVEWRGWNIHVEDYPVSIGMEAFIAEVAEKTNGDVTGTVFHQGVLGSQPDAIEQLRLGAIDFAEFSLGPLGPVAPEANVVSLPFIFKDIPTMYRLMDGEVGAAIGEGLAAKGIIALAYYDAGARSFYNGTRPITSPADVEGLKIRVMSNDLFVGMVNAMGGNATPMAFAEVYQSLKTNVVDGAENNPPSYESTAHYEVAKYYSITEHLIIPEVLAVSKASWDRLTEEQQDIVRTAAQNSAELQRGLWQDREAASLETVVAGGTIINRIDDKTPFQDAMAPVYEQFLADNPDLADLVNLIRNAE